MKNELLLWKSANSLWYAQPTSDDTSLLRTLSKLIRRQKLLVLFSKKRENFIDWGLYLGGWVNSHTIIILVHTGAAWRQCELYNFSRWYEILLEFAGKVRALKHIEHGV